MDAIAGKRKGVFEFAYRFVLNGYACPLKAVENLNSRLEDC